MALRMALTATADTSGYRGFVTCPASLGDSVSRKMYVNLPALPVEAPVIRIWGDQLVPSGSFPKSEAHVLQTLSRGCRCTSIMFTKATKKCSKFSGSVPQPVGQLPPYSRRHLQQELPRSHGGVRTQCPQAKAKGFILSLQDLHFACRQAPLYSQRYT